MSCINCKNSEICLIYDNFKKFDHIAEIEISNCNNFLGEDSSVNRPNNKKFRNIDLNKLNELSKKNDDIKKNERIESLKSAPKPKQIKAVPLKLDSKCETCNAETYSSDIGKCDKCNKPICSVCATYDADSQMVLCETCWKES